MGVMDKFLNYMKLNDEEDDYEDDDYYYDEEEAESAPKAAMKKEPAYTEEEKPAPKKVNTKVTPMRQTSSTRKITGSGMEVCVIKPTSVEDGREITETLLSNRTVVLNLEGLDVEVAQRIIDFTSGSCYAIAGNLQKISHYIFIVTPSTVDISGDFQDILNGGSFEMPINKGF
ncbi:MAG: cell division protein SepF [Lachnospiraceae bacterium]|nr:cell division protein SepF [Lachnospiraceae bacterium]